MVVLRTLACYVVVLFGSAAAVACSGAEDTEPGGGDGDGGAGGGGGGEGGAEVSTWQVGPVSVVQEAGSAWQVAEEAGEIVAHHVEVDVQLLIDPTNTDDDQRYAGVYVFEAGQVRFTGTYYGSECSMFVPDRPHVNQTAVSVVAAGASLTVEMTEGSLSEMVDSQFESDEPFRWESTWTIGADGLEVQGRGLYYLLVPKESCDVSVLGEGGSLLGSVHIDSDTSPMFEYFEDVRTIDIASSVLGALSVATDAQVLQVEVTSYPDTSLFELDFDHSFKDQGQLEVYTELRLPVGL